MIEIHPPGPDPKELIYILPKDLDRYIKEGWKLVGETVIDRKLITCCRCGSEKSFTFLSAEERLIKTVRLGYFPQAMLFNRGLDKPEGEMRLWRRFQREWANKTIVGKKMQQYASSLNKMF